ncbi:MAG: nitroreductase family protein [Oscillospiraceae bacterium]|nr:nitroreductase family protein [Oscillospiraceae bacterium]
MQEAIKNRRSIRKFKVDKLVTKEQLNQMLEAAMLAPSACNARPWEFVAVTKRSVLDEIARIHPYAKMCETATAAIVVVATPKDEFSAEFFPQDCGAATQNILLEAAAMGLGTCWCGIYPIEDRKAHFCELLSIAEEKIPFCIIAIGYPDEEPEARGFFEEAKVTYIM